MPKSRPADTVQHNVLNPRPPEWTPRINLIADAPGRPRRKTDKAEPVQRKAADDEDLEPTAAGVLSIISGAFMAWYYGGPRAHAALTPAGIGLGRLYPEVGTKPAMIIPT